MTYSIEIKRPAVKTFKKIPYADQIEISKLVQALSVNPRPQYCIKLSGSPYYRIRHGDYRVIYDIQDEQLIIMILKIGHRRDVYR